MPTYSDRLPKVRYFFDGIKRKRRRSRTVTRSAIRGLRIAQMIENEQREAYADTIYCKVGDVYTTLPTLSNITYP
jgi:hypothetical protein